MTDFAQPTNPSQPPHHSAWRRMIIDFLRAEYPEALSQRQQVRFLEELAQRFTALKEWERYEPRFLSGVTRKEGYREVARLMIHDGAVTSVHGLPDGRIVSGGSDKTVRVWHPSHTEQGWYETLVGHDDRVWCVRGLPDGRILSGSSDCTVRSWARTASGWAVGSTNHFEAAVWCLQPLPDGSVATGHGNGDLFISHLTSGGAWRSRFVGSTSPVTALQVLPDGAIVTGHSKGYIGSVRLWSADADGKWHDSILAEFRGYPINSLHVRLGGHIVVAGGGGLFELSPGTDGKFSSSVIRQQDTRYGVRCVQALPDGRIVSCGTDDRIVVQNRREPQEEFLLGHENTVSALQVLSDGRIISVSSDRSIRIWDGDPVTDGGAS